MSPPRDEKRREPQPIAEVLRGSSDAGVPQAPARVPVVGDVVRDVRFRDVVVTIEDITRERVVMTNGSSEPFHLFHRIYEFEDGTPIAPLTDPTARP